VSKIEMVSSAVPNRVSLLGAMSKTSSWSSSLTMRWLVVGL